MSFKLKDRSGTETTYDKNTIKVPSATTAGTYETFVKDGIIPSGTQCIENTSTYDVSTKQYAILDSTNLSASNIKKDVTILGVTGTYEGGTPTSGTLTIDWSNLGERQILPETYGYDYFDKVINTYNGGDHKSTLLPFEAGQTSITHPLITSEYFPMVLCNQGISGTRALIFQGIMFVDASETPLGAAAGLQCVGYDADNGEAYFRAYGVMGGATMDASLTISINTATHTITITSFIVNEQDLTAILPLCYINCMLVTPLNYT